MAYTAGVFYIDLVSGSDAARTALTGCIASNPSGTITRINKTAHGLVTGAVVDLTLFSTWLNGAWKITKVDNDNFDLDTAVWQTTADTNGTVTPRGGSSWSDAWRTMTTGASATRVQSGDEVRVSKTDDPVSIGSATWTDASKTVTLATAQTLKIDNCETAWTAANSATVATSTTRKQGSNSVRVIRSASVTTNTLYAYKALGSTVDFSAYDAITLWIQAYSSSSILANNWVISLCSDTAGATAVDSFAVPASATTGQWYPVTLTRTGGGALGSSIQSIALYSGSVAPLTTCGISIDNISACDADGLNLRTLISKDSSATFNMSEGWWGIQSIDGTTVLLDALTNTLPTSGQGYYGTTETVTTYARKTFAQGPFATVLTDVNQLRSRVIYSGGWDTSTSTKNGMTVLDGVNGYGRNTGVITATFAEFNDFWATRFSYGIVQSPATNAKISNFGCSNADIPLSATAFTRTSFTNCFIHSSNQNFGNSQNTNVQSGSIFTNCKFLSHLTSPAVNASADCQFINCTFANNTTSDAAFAQKPMGYTAIGSTFTNAISVTGGSIYTKNCLFSGATEFTTPAAYTNQRIHSQQHDQTAYDYIVTDGGTMNTETTDRSGQTGNMWRLVLTNTTRTSDYPLDLPVGQFAVTANNLVTVSAWMKKSHATNCNGRLRVRAYQLAGLTSDVTATLADTTDWQELTLTFTPTEAGVFEVEALAEYVAANANVYIDTISVSQA